MLEEDHGARTAIYRLRINGNEDLGKIKSSGLIVSTGTGSSGLLYSANRPT